ncbi:MAG: aconitase X catalytic domain-containing protein [Thermoplasmatales archaeon]|nr:aconitase X catalytic domain-containing protein [Thermoplasmatales archaeon]
MYLTPEQEKMLDGEEGEIVARMLRLLVRLGEVYKAEKMIEVSSAQIAGVSYKSIEDAGLEFLEDIAKEARVKILTYLNPAGMDLEKWEEMGISKEFAEKQMAIINAFKKMGIVISATCTPYLAGNLPRYRQHIAWSESSAVSFANSVIGARTNREGGPSALAAAITGLTPYYGLHLDENREPDFIIDVKANLLNPTDFAALGYHVGEEIKNKIPYFRGIKDADVDDLKQMGAAMAAAGAVAMYHVEGITPEANEYEIKGKEKIEVGNEDVEEVYSKLSNSGDVDIVIFGCPHASLNEIIKIAKFLGNRKAKRNFWICTSRAVKEVAERMGINEKIEKAGGKIIADTCMVVSPIEKIFEKTGVNSAKAAHYLPSFCNQKVLFARMEELI